MTPMEREKTMRSPTTDAPPQVVHDDEAILATADVAASPERVLRALTTKELERWWGADVYKMTEWAADVRVGGRWSVGIVFPGAPIVGASGEFLEVDPARKIVQTRVYDWEHPTLGRRPTRVSYLAVPIAAGTRLAVRHEGFAGNTVAAGEHAGDWDRVLRGLQVYARAHAQE
jgi:uncharacterized protein YndB with AHSA1/START domain